MSTPAAAFEVKGWCPGALCPMQSGDGLIVRIRPRLATLARSDMLRIADAADRYGNGHIDLTRRANLQIRGVRPETLGPLQETLNSGGLLDETAEAESIRNILVSPLSGLDDLEILDMRPLAAKLAGQFAAQPAAWRLPAKFTFVLDGGGQLRLDGERASIRLLAYAAGGRTMIAIAHDGEWIGIAAPDDAVSAIASIIAGQSPKLQSVGTLSVQRKDILAMFADRPQSSPLRLRAGRYAVRLGVPFGRLEVDQLRILADFAAEIRLSPWRTVYVPAPDEADAERVAALAQDAGFIIRAGDPLMRIQACPGHPACPAAHADTRADALKIALWMRTRGFEGTAHVSGCAKGCASSAPADITLVGTPGGYRLLHHATTRKEGGTFIHPSGIPEQLDD